MTKATVTLNDQKITVELETISAEFQMYRVYKDGTLVGVIEPCQTLKGYWSWKTRGHARTYVALRRGRPAAIKELLTAR